MRLTRLPICAAGLLGAGLVSAASTHARRGVECYFEIPADSGDTCESLATSWGLSVDLFTKINPGVQCPSLEAGKSYCVIGEWTPDETTSPPSPPPTTTTTTTTRSQPPTTTAPTTSPSTTPSNAPTMPGVAPDCDRFYKVRSGDQCDTIASRNGITVAQLRSWNAEINDACSNLWLDYYICVHVPGAAPPPSATTTTAPAPSNSPTMPGVAPNCDRFHKIQSGDQCDAIARTYGITVAQLRSWNTQIDAACSNLWLDYYICVHVPGAATTTSTAPAPSNSPTLPGALEHPDQHEYV
ncbi:hypothetical protein VTK73DRAFT_2594 [Phialemonium thermophilum]|uniref:LysM domain-containing protein n=1 Tax=Phialemonium thermophilum TaxID=223376 RepID=A0ABR3VRY4_9PEZI